MTRITVVCAGRRVYRSTSPLIALIAEVLATSCGYRMSEEVIKLLERDADLLAAQRVAGVASARAATISITTRLPAQDSQSIGGNRGGKYPQR
jgi:hypothetical protein